MTKKLYLIFILTLIISGCSQSEKVQREAVCIAFKPIYPSSDDVLTDNTSNQIESYNNVRSAACIDYSV